MHTRKFWVHPSATVAAMLIALNIGYVTHHNDTIPPAKTGAPSLHPPTTLRTSSLLTDRQPEEIALITPPIVPQRTADAYLAIVGQNGDAR